ncbi:MAG: ribosome silencing factor [Candidatus Omnitrophota bacterium]|nr:MAG: ribosome silencing factor [Candidatus Omnitrophota bacterium]
MRDLSFQDYEGLTGRGGKIKSRSKALFIAKTAQDKKAQDIVILDIRKASGITDFFIICSGTSARQVKAISDHIIERLKEQGQRAGHIEGYNHALWVLLDCGDIVVHVFHAPVRDFYDLERLWGDVPQITLKDHGSK